ncbi:MAG TPA: hypothetical protein VGG08_01480 [Solirubrobacteraceae bacterium]|jgi:hypothetical protein
MKRLSLAAVLACAALSIVLSVAVASPASAAVLPEFTVETNLTATFGTSKLNTSGAEIKSTEGVFNDSEVESKKLGKGLIWFKLSSLGGKECHSTSPSDTEGNILVPVIWHLVHPKGSTIYLILFLVKATTISCKFLATKVEVLEGSTILGRITGTGKTTSFKLEVNVPEGKQEFTSYENDAGETISTELKLKVDGVSAKGTQEDQAATITTEKATELIN